MQYLNILFNYLICGDKKNHITILSCIIISCISSSVFFLPISHLSFAQKDDANDKLVVRANINLKNVDLEKGKFIRVIGFINGEEVKEDIPISSIGKTKKTLNVDLKTDIKNEVVKVGIKDEFFVCAYQVGDVRQEYNSLTKFDCNEEDIQSIRKPTEVNLFSSDSQAYAHSKAVYDDNIKKTTMDKSDTVKLEILVPLKDRKDIEKLKIAAMIKGQIKSEVIEAVQTELDKSKDGTIKRIFTFDRDTDLGKIQLGDRYHACVSSNDLRPPGGTECEYRVLPCFNKLNSLPAR